jgi:hypothetical protein
MESRVYLSHPCDRLPDRIRAVVNRVIPEGSYPGPLLDRIRRDRALFDLSMIPSFQEVKRYYDTHFFPTPDHTDVLERSDGGSRAQLTLPDSRDMARADLPVPDTLFGYNHTAFPPSHLAADMGRLGSNGHGLICPFLVIEIQDDARLIDGNLWLAAKRCLGASASCVDMVDRINRRLWLGGAHEGYLVSTAVFNIAMSSTEARLYVAWKDDEHTCKMRLVETFLLQRPELWLEFRAFVWNILDWGQHARLRDIDSALYVLSHPDFGRR